MPRGILIGIAGGSASGKTMVASRIHQTLGSERVLVLKQDSYYRDLSHLTPEEREAHNFDHPDAFDTPLLLQHLQRLLQGGYVEEPIYDFTRHCRLKQTRRIGRCPVVVLEGILILADAELRAWMDIKVYVETDADIRLLRRLRRDVEERGRTVASVLHQYEHSVRPMHLQFVEASKRYADVIIPEGGYNDVAIDLLRTKIAAILVEKGTEEWPDTEQGHGDGTDATGGTDGRDCTDGTDATDGTDGTGGADGA